MGDRHVGRFFRGLRLGCAVVLCLGAAACGDDSDGGDSAPAGAAAVFSDPQGTYTLDVPAEWKPFDAPVREVEAWVVAEPAGGFAPNVNVLTQDSSGIDLAGYLDVSTEQAKNLMPEFKLISSTRVPAEGGGELGRLEYVGLQGGQHLQFLAIVSVGGATAVVATFTAPPDRFEAIRADVEQHLLTLRPA